MSFSKYPNALDTSLELPAAVDTVTQVKAEVVNRLRDAVMAIEAELGIQPSSTFSTVRDRLDDMSQLLVDQYNQFVQLVEDAEIGIPTSAAGGDLGSNYPNPIVVGLRGKSIADIAPTDGYALAWSASDNYWVPKLVGGGAFASKINLLFFPSVSNTDSSIFVNVGTIEFDPTKLSTSPGTPVVKLKVICETTAPLLTLQLYNFTTTTVVTSSTLSTTSTTATTLTTADLVSNLTNGNAIYQLQMKMDSSGGSSDRVNVDFACLEITWS